MDTNVLEDSGSTRCLINLPIVLKLYIREKQLSQLMQFKQANGTLIGGAPATHLIELVCREIGEHWELIHFVVIPKMMEAVILGLAWLDKWCLIIWWEDGVRTLRLVTGPTPPPQTSSQIESQGQGKPSLKNSVNSPPRDLLIPS